MALLTRKRLVLAKLETTYGVDSTPTGSQNAMLVKNLNINPVQAELVSRDLIRPFLGNSEQLLAQYYVQMDFEVEMVGSGVIGKAPAYDPLLRACGFSPATIQSSVVPVAIASNVATVTLNAHGYNVGDVVLMSGFGSVGLNGEKTITAKTTNTFSFAAPGEPDGAASGSPKVNLRVEYSPISEAFESLTLYYNVDGVLHKVRGAYGNVEMNLAAKQIPVFKFSFTGLYTPVEDAAAPVVDFTSFKIPQLANTQNTPGFSLFGYGSVLESMALNLNNQVQYITLIGREDVKILDRQPSGTLVFEAPKMISHDYFSEVINSTSGAMTLDHGSKNGYKVSFSAPAALLGNPGYQDSNGIQMLSAPFTISPVTGNDEIKITIK